MKKVLLLLALALAITACTDAQTNKFIAGITNFQRGVAAVDDAIAQVSATLYKNCKAAQSVGQAASDITGSCAKASPVVDSVNTVINNYCQRDQVTDIASAIAVTATSVSAVKSQLSAAKKACAS